MFANVDLWGLAVSNVTLEVDAERRAADVFPVKRVAPVEVARSLPAATPGERSCDLTQAASADQWLTA